MQKVEGIKDQARAPRPVRRGLCLGEAWKAVRPYPAQFAVEIGCLRPEGRKRGLHDGIFIGPVEAGPGQKLCLAAFNPHRHAETIKFDLVKPFRS
jgi:hypothetical protein